MKVLQIEITAFDNFDYKSELVELSYHDEYYEEISKIGYAIISETPCRFVWLCKQSELPKCAGKIAAKFVEFLRTEAERVSRIQAQFEEVFELSN